MPDIVSPLRPPVALAISSYSAGGQETVMKLVLELDPSFERIVTCTTRTPRPGEVHGKSYFFHTDPEFDKLEADYQLLESERVHGRDRYGLPKLPLMNAILENRRYLFHINVDGHRTIRRKLQNHPLQEVLVSVFLYTPADVLEKRMRARDPSITQAEIDARMGSLEKETMAIPEYDAMVENVEGRPEVAARQVLELANERAKWWHAKQLCSS